MQNRQFRVEPDSPLRAKIIVQILKHTKSDQTVNLAEIAEAAGSTFRDVAKTLGLSLGIDDYSTLELQPFHRFKLASDAARLGALQSVARALTWQEFETFSEECLSRMGFQTQKGVILKDDARRWQIDIVARRAQIVLAVDCKHWDSPNYPSKFNRAAEHQKQALSLILRSQRSSQASYSAEWGLPVILTLFDPRSPILDDVVLVSVGQLSDFLNHLTPYDQRLPFVTSDLTESPISQP